MGDLIREIIFFCDSKACFYKSDDIPAGKNWREWIMESIAASNQLWLLYTDPTSNLRWPLYESGIFTGLKEASQQEMKLICFFPPNSQMPDTLADFEGVQITKASIQQFLKGFFFEIDCAVAKDDRKIEEIADKCSKVLEAAIATQYSQIYNKAIEIEFSFHGKNAEDEDIEGGSIQTESYITDLFGVNRLQETWGELLGYMKGKAESEEGKRTALQEAIKQIHEAIRSGCRGEDFDQPTRQFRGISDNKSYLPVLHRITIRRGISETQSCARLIFVKQG